MVPLKIPTPTPTPLRRSGRRAIEDMGSKDAEFLKMLEEAKRNPALLPANAGRRHVASYVLGEGVVQVLHRSWSEMWGENPITNPYKSAENQLFHQKVSGMSLFEGFHKAATPPESFSSPNFTVEPITSL